METIQDIDINNLDTKIFKEKPCKLGNSNVEISLPIGIGTWAWGDKWTWGYGSYDQTFSDESLKEAFFSVVDNGINFFDTAEIYGFGKSEILLGQFIKEYKSNKEKRDIIVATKFLPYPWRISQSSLKDALNNSLQRLQLSYIDLYQVHGPAFSVRKVETWAEAMAPLVKEGKIRAIGVSNYNIDQVKRTHAILEKYGIPLATNQIEFSLLRNNAMKNGLLETCKQLGITIIAYSPLGMGRLTGKYTKSNPPKGLRKFGDVPFEVLDDIVSKLKGIGANYGKTPGQVAINWCICKGTIPIVGVKNKKQAEENIQSIGWRLSNQEIEELDKLSVTPTNNFFQEIWQEK
jgi:aryl-alcohol dehydrogenase-like predicted oxidoreductase